ncbi:hypothetical protein H4R21_003528, partial [Coemansia helicoidea]
QKSKTLGDEAIDPNSWGNLRSTLLFEFSEQFAEDRAMIQLLAIRQLAGESGSEYTQRFVGLVSGLVGAHLLDSKLLAVLFAGGLRSEKARLDILVRRLSSLDKAVGYVAPDQLYKVAKLTALLSPAPATPPAVDSAGELSPTSDAPGPLAGCAAGSYTYVDEADELSLQAVYGSGGAGDGPDADTAGAVSTPVARGSTANGASFALDSDDAPPAVDDDSGSGRWSPPRLPDAQQRRLHRRNMAAHARTGEPAPGSVGGAAAAAAGGNSWAHRHATLPSGMDGHYGRDERPRAGSGSETDDQTRSAAELNSLADQLESLTVMLRTQSDARRRRPRLCYRCRQKGHVASDCPLPPDVAVPNLQMRERMGLSPSATMPRATALSSFSTPGSWRGSASPVAAAAASGAAATVSCSPGRPAPPRRRFSQSWGRNGPQSTTTTK